MALARGLGGDVQGHLRKIDPVDVPALPREPDLRNVFLPGEHSAVASGGRRRQPAAVASHHFVDDEHPRIGPKLGDNIPEIARALLRGRPGAERLADRIDVVVDRLWKSDDGKAVVVFREKGGQFGGGRVRVVSANRVEHVDAVLDEAVGGHLLGILPLLHQAALQAVLQIGEFHAAVADRAASVTVEDGRLGAHLRGDPVAVPEQQPLVAAAIGDDLYFGGDFRIALDQAPDRGAEAGGEAAGGQQGDFLRLSGMGHGGGNEAPISPNPAGLSSRQAAHHLAKFAQAGAGAGDDE